MSMPRYPEQPTTRSRSGRTKLVGAVVVVVLVAFIVLHVAGVFGH